VTQDTSIFKDKTGSKEGPALEITKPIEDSGDNSPRADADLRESMENDFEVILSEDDLWDEGDHPIDIRLFDSYGESDKKELTLSTEEAIPPDKARESRSQETVEAKLPDEASWIIWTITGVSGILLTVGLVLLWNLSAPFFEPHSAVTEDIPGTLANHGDFETLDLAPFLIPAQDISSGIQEKFLMQYRQPIVRCLNHELAPLRVEDIRLKGYLMK
jgi:hypothetical protein